MLTAQRKQFILNRLRADGQVSVPGLAVELQVSEDSIRRDLRDLAEEGLVQRVHGGALPASPALGNYERREQISPEVKARLGKAAALLVRPGHVVAIDGGTTNLELVRALPRDLQCTVITHSPLIAAELRLHSAIEIILIGGKIFRHSQVAMGSETAAAIARVRTDLFFLGATGIHAETGATTGDWEEAGIKRAFCRGAAETVLLVSPEKLGAASPFQIVAAADLAVLVVAGETSDSLIEPFRTLGLEIVKTALPG